METTLYAVFTVFCFPAPAITNKIGTRQAMFWGILGYGALVGASLLYYLDVVGQWAVIAGGGINGVGAALLWTAQVRRMHLSLACLLASCAAVFVAGETDAAVL